MASPLKFFRKYSAGMMIVLVILSMLIFTMDSVFSDSSLNLWLLGMLIGGAVFGIAGIGQGRWLQWALGGAALGTVLGFILPGFVQEGGLSTALGVIDEEQMNDLEMRRAIANQLLFQATEASFGEGTGRFAPLFGFNPGSGREDVIFGKLMRAEADRLGIAVDRTMVNEYLMRATSEKLTKENYLKIRNNLAYNNKPMTDDVLFEILGDEIKARMAYQMLRPRTTALPPGPEVYWNYFRRLNVRQQIETVALDVDAFVQQIPDPSDAEVNQLYTQYKKKFPNEESPGSPGFRLPFRAKLAYLELDYASVEAQAGEVTDADIEKYYADNKETPMIRTPVIPDASKAEPSEEKKPEAEPTSDAAPEKTPSEDAKKPEASATEKPATEKPADPAPEAKSDAKPAAEEKPAPAEPAAPAAEKPAEPKVEEKPSETPASEAEKASEGDSCGPAADEAEVESEAKADEAGPETATTEAADKAEAKPATEEKPVAEEKPASPAADQPSTALPSLTIPAAVDPPAKPEVKAEPELQYEYRPLDDELKSEIRSEILRQRTRDAIQKKMDAAVAFMESIARERSKQRFSLIEQDAEKYEGRGDAQQEALRQLREKMHSYNSELNDRVRKYGKENGLAYVETPLVSYADLLDEEDYPVGVATEPNDSPFMAAQSANVALTVFQAFSNDEQNNDAQLYLVRRAQRTKIGLENSESHFVYWSIDFSAAHIPALEEPGVRDTVVMAWKRSKARELAQKRGEELALKIREGLAKEGEERQDPTAALKDETVSGKPEGAALAVRKSMPFSWLRTSSASPMNFQAPQASQSPITFEDAAGGTLEMVGEDFMKSIFEEMQDEQVSVVPNGDLSKYYVVRVTNRFPTPEVGEDGLRERFATEGKQFAFAQSPILGVMQQQLESPAVTAWERSVWQRYGVDPDGDPEETE